MPARASEALRLRRTFLRPFALLTLALLFAVAPAFAQGSGLDYMNKASFDDARSPEQAAAKFFNNGERHLHKAEKIQQKAGGGAELVEKAKAEYQRAASDFEKALGKDPTLIDARLHVGQIYAQLGELEKSLSACHQVWAMDAKRYKAAVCEARASLKLDRPRGAQEVYLVLRGKDSESAATVLAELKSWTESHPSHTSAEPLKTWLNAQSAAPR